MTLPGDSHECFTDFALEEYVQGRLDPSVRAQLEAHTAACAQCGRAVDLLRVESALLSRALISMPGREAPVRTDDHALAAYLDGALDNVAAEALEALLANDPALLDALVQLSREVEAPSEQGSTAGMAQGIPEGRILRMPVRQAMPAVIMPIELKFGDGRPA